MVPTKSTAPKKSPKPKTLPPVEKTISKMKKKKKKSYHNFGIYLYKLLRSVSKEKMGISKKSILIMNSFVYDMMEKIAAEAGKLTNRSKKSTMSSVDMQAAVKLTVPGELAAHANMDALKAVSLYHNSQN